MDHYVQDLVRRLTLLGEQKASFVLSCLSPEFCEIHPRECARLADHPDRALKDLLATPEASRWSELLAGERPRRLVLDNRMQADLFDRLRGYATSELLANRGRQAHTSVDRHVAEFAPLFRGFARNAEFLASLGEYGQAVIEEESGVAGKPPEACERELAALLWEERCRRENRLLDLLPEEAGFWLHLGRVMTRHVYDDSYWLAPEELLAAEEAFPDHLQLR